MLTSIDYKVTFNLTASPKAFIFEDLTDYVSQSVLEADVTGILSCTGPDGTVFYSNPNYAAPDIDVDVSRINSTTINIPLLANGLVEPGIYLFQYSVQDSSDSTIVSLEKSFEYCYVSPTVTLEMSADCIMPRLTSDDTTNYVVELITPTITRVHTIQFPLGSGEADLVSLNKKIETGLFYTQTNQSEVVSSLLYDYGGGVFIQDSVSGVTELDVQCDSSLCDLYCCLYSLYKRWQEALCVNSIMAEALQDKFVQAQAVRNLIKDSIECGKGENISALTAKVLALGDCEPGCGCADGEPVPVFGLGGSSDGDGNNLYIVSPGTGIVVSDFVAGDTTTYTVAIDPAILALINAATNVAVFAGTGGITVDTNIVSGQTQYTINNDPVPTQSGPGMVSLVYSIVKQTGNVPSLNTETEVVYGASRFQSPVLTNEYPILADYKSNNTRFLVSGFLDNATNYSVTAQIVKIVAVKNGVDQQFLYEPFRLEVIDKSPSYFRFHFVNQDGSPLTGNALNVYDTIKISIQIIE
jgi:hypothetical protein